METGGTHLELGELSKYTVVDQGLDGEEIRVETTALEDGQDQVLGLGQLCKLICFARRGRDGLLADDVLASVENGLGGRLVAEVVISGATHLGVLVVRVVYRRDHDQLDGRVVEDLLQRRNDLDAGEGSSHLRVLRRRTSLEDRHKGVVFLQREQEWDVEDCGQRWSA